MRPAADMQSTKYALLHGPYFRPTPAAENVPPASIGSAKS